MLHFSSVFCFYLLSFIRPPWKTVSGDDDDVVDGLHCFSELFIGLPISSFFLTEGGFT